MKNFLMVLLASFLTLSVTAQTITVTFNGVNKNQNFQVLLDGTSYYSNSNTYPNNGTGNSGKKIILLNQKPGNHTIVVYRLKNSVGSYSNGTNIRPYGKAIYSKTFQIRQDYDMDIRINGNGRVMFSEKRITALAPAQDNTPDNIVPMTDARFEQLLQSVKSKYLQSSKLTVERNALLSSANYFTTDQVSQLLSLITSEANKVAMAKLAYPKITDPANFTQLYEVFASENSKDEMNVYIRNNPNNNSNDNNNNNNNNNWGNNANTKAPMANYQFNQLLQSVKNQWNQAGKFNVVSDAFNNTSYYFSVSQIRQLLSLITTEGDRLALAKLSYARVFDAASFTSLYDMFSSQANRDDLNNFINGTNNQYTTRTAMADNQFNQILQSVNSQWNQAGKFNTVRNAFNTTVNYFSTAQIRQLLSLVNAESDRLALAKLSYSRVSDPANFTSLYDLLNGQASRNDLNNYVIQNGGTGSNVQYNTRIQMTDANFSQVLQKVSNHFLPWDKVRDARDAFTNTSYFFSTAQIRQILSVIASENDRLELAKLSWSRVTDPNNFTQLFDLFTNQSFRDDLNAYIQARPF